MRKNTKVGALCLYGLCGLPAEVQFAQLVRGRDREVFRQYGLEFFLECFALTSDEVQEQTCIKNVYKYVYTIQSRFAEELMALGIVINKPEDREIVDAIRNLHKKLRDGPILPDTLLSSIASLDGLVEGFDDLEHVTLEIADSTKDLASCTLQEFVDTYSLFCYFLDICSTIDFAAAVDHHVIMGEAMAFSAHVARAYVFGLLEKCTDGEKDLTAGLLHLRRAILDMRKGIVITICGYEAGAEPKFISVEEKRRLLGVRYEEVVLSPHSPGKCRLYADEMQSLLFAWRDYLEADGVQNLPAYE